MKISIERKTDFCVCLGRFEFWMILQFFRYIPLWFMKFIYNLQIKIKLICTILFFYHSQQAKASVHAIDEDLRTALMYAAEEGYTSVVRYLLKCHAVPDARVRSI